MNDCSVLQRVLTEHGTKVINYESLYAAYPRPARPQALRFIIACCYMAGAKWNCCPRQSGRRVRYTTMIQLCTHTPSISFRHLPPPNRPTACPDSSFAGTGSALRLTFEPVTWRICLKNNQQCICQVFWTWSNSHTLLYENLYILLPTIANANHHT